MSTKNMKVSGSSSLERLIPDEIQQGESTGETTLKLHMERYEWAAKLIGGDSSSLRILDAACGVGYGSEILATSNPGVDVVGADVDIAAVDFAQDRYGASGVKYIASDIMEIEGSNRFDVVVSLETIEHVADPLAVINKFRALLRPQGLFILSVPVTPSIDVNPYHLTDFSVSSVRKILHSANFEIIDELSQVQKFSVVRMLTKQESRLADMRDNLAYYYMKNPASLIKRIYSTLRFGFTNRYLTLACRKIE